MEKPSSPINLFVTLFFVGGANDFKNSVTKVDNWVEALKSTKDVDHLGNTIWNFSNVHLHQEISEIRTQFRVRKTIRIETIEEEERTINALKKVDAHIRLKSGLVEIWSGDKDLCLECIRKIAFSLFGDPKYFSKVKFNDLDFEKIRTKFVEITGTKLDKLRHPHLKEIGFKGFDVTRSGEYVTFRRDSSGKIKMLSGWMVTPISVVPVSIYRWGRIRFTFVDSIDTNIVEKVITEIERIIVE